MTRLPDEAALEEAFLRCKRCGNCLEACPVYGAALLETLGPRARVALAEAYLSGELGAADAEEALFACALCLACRDACQNGVPTDGVILAARARLAGERPSPRLLAAAHRLLGRPVLPLALKRLALGVALGRPPRAPRMSFRGAAVACGPAAGKGGPGAPPVQFFVGCLLNHLYPEAARAVTHTLLAAGMRVEIPEGQGCCGAPFFGLGAFEEGFAFAAASAAAFQGDGPVVVGCGLGCEALGGAAAGAGASPEALSPRIRCYSELLLKHGEELLSRCALPEERVVTWHDPCRLRRGRGVWREPREILRRIRGVRFVEMEGAEVCCGRGGGLPLRQPGIYRRIGRRKAVAVIKSGAQVVVTECPHCMVGLEEALRAVGAPVRVAHIAQVVAEALPGARA